MADYDLNDRVYQAQGGHFSIADLLHNFTDPELQIDGMPRVSDLHMKVGEAVRFRFDGELEIVEGGEALTEEALRRLVYPMLSEAQRDTLEQSPFASVDAGFTWGEGNVSFRLNVFHERDGLACVMRMLPSKLPEADELGFLHDRTWEELVDLKQGLVLVTGVTGSGKSTTIASLLDRINKTRKARIITLEDPIEYLFHSQQSLISQRELGEHMESFGHGLRSALRENPDIIYVGEIRDPETAALALTAAETGHLVFATLHTKDVIGAFGRLVDMFPAERSSEVATQLSFALAFVISQKLLRKKDGLGRVPAFEVMKNSGGVGNIIRTNKLAQIYGRIETGSNEGMNTLEQHLLELYAQGRVTKEEAVLHANDAAVIGRLDELDEDAKDAKKRRKK